MIRFVLLPFFVVLIGLGIFIEFTEGQAGIKAFEEGRYDVALEELSPIAEDGDAEAQYLLGQIYEQGLGGGKDVELALKWYQIAADQGHEGALKALNRIKPDTLMSTNKSDEQQYNEEKNSDLANRYQMGWDALNSGELDTALSIWTVLAEEGHAEAQFNLGVFYSDEGAVPKDVEKALKWIRLSANQGHAPAQFTLGVMYHLGNGVPQDDKIAFGWYKLAAEQGDATSQSVLGDIYRDGRGVAKDLDKALKWTKLAADQGLERAIEALTLLAKKKQETSSSSSQQADEDFSSAKVDKIEGAVKQDITPDLEQAYKQATKLFKTGDFTASLEALLPLAEQGHVLAQYNVGVLHRDGLGTKQNYKVAIKWFKLAVDQNYANAQFNLGNMYRDGHGVEQDYETAVALYRLAAAQGHASGQYMLGALYIDGFGVSQDYDEALKWFRLSADQKSSYAQVALGQLYRDGLGVPEDRSKAVEFFQLAADQGDEEGKRQLALLLASQLSNAKEASKSSVVGSHALQIGLNAFEKGDYFDAMEKLFPLAEDGEMEAQFVLGQMYRKGLGVDKDGGEALKWAQLAANQGHQDAQYYMGLTHHFGFGLRKDPQKAAEWYKRAADQGHESAKKNLSRLGTLESPPKKNVEVASVPKPKRKPDAIPPRIKSVDVLDLLTINPAAIISQTMNDAKKGDPAAQYFLGNFYSRGDGIAKDDAQALKWYLRSAEQGYEKAQLEVSILYYAGEKVPEDLFKAYKWGLQAAVKGNPDAQHLLGVLKEYGEGTTKDLKAAVKWYKLSAAQGYPLAQTNLGRLYLLGYGTAQETIRGYMWLSLAAAQGNKTAKKYRDKAKLKLTSSEIMSAENMARNCMAQNYQGC